MNEWLIIGDSYPKEVEVIIHILDRDIVQTTWEDFKDCAGTRALRRSGLNLVNCGNGVTSDTTGTYYTHPILPNKNDKDFLNKMRERVESSPWIKLRRMYYGDVPIQSYSFKITLPYDYYQKNIIPTQP